MIMLRRRTIEWGRSKNGQRIEYRKDRRALTRYGRA